MAVQEHLTEAQLKRVRIGLNLPGGIVERLDAEAKRRGVTRQALIKMWLSDRLDHAA